MEADDLSALSEYCAYLWKKSFYVDILHLGRKIISLHCNSMDQPLHNVGSLLYKKTQEKASELREGGTCQGFG